MKVFVTINGQPAIAIAFAQSKGGAMMAIVIGLGKTLEAIPLSDCVLPRLPRRLRKKIDAQVKRETRKVQEQLLSPN